MLETHPVNMLRRTRVGIVLSLFTILMGFALGGIFGYAEDSLKADLASRAQAVLATAYGNDEVKLKATTEKAWAYYKRAHLHGGAIGSAALLVSILLALVPRTCVRLAGIVAGGTAVGALGYSIFWFWAGYRAPSLGSTGAAKESLRWLAAPTSILCMLGMAATLLILAVELFGSRRHDQPKESP